MPQEAFPACSLGDSHEQKLVPSRETCVFLTFWKNAICNQFTLSSLPRIESDFKMLHYKHNFDALLD